MPYARTAIIFVDIYRPRIITETVLPSITSPRLSSIFLDLAENGPEDDFPEADYPARTMTENHIKFVGLPNASVLGILGKRWRWLCSGRPHKSQK